MKLSASGSKLFRFGIFEVDLKRAQLRKAGVKQKLAGQPFQVLRALVERAVEVVTREELRDLLWSDDTLVDYDLALKKAINRVREGTALSCVPSCGRKCLGKKKFVAEACGSRSYLELILQVLPRKPLGGNGTT